MPEALRKSATALFPGIGRSANDWVVVSVSARYDASAAAYTGKTRLRMQAWSSRAGNFDIKINNT